VYIALIRAGSCAGSRSAGSRDPAQDVVLGDQVGAVLDELAIQSHDCVTGRDLFGGQQAGLQGVD
jgi:hypothetical protein